MSISARMVEAGVAALQEADGEPDAVKVAQVYVAMAKAAVAPEKASDHVAYRDMEPKLPEPASDDGE